jgi:hypothetical protein
MADRYEGKPFLKLLDCYVLDSIGHLDAASDAALTAMEPKLRQTFGATGDWRTIVIDRMQFPKGMAGAILDLWQKGRTKFVAANGRDPDPGEFTRIFVDTNFPH